MTGREIRSTVFVHAVQPCIGVFNVSAHRLHRSRRRRDDLRRRVVHVTEALESVPGVEAATVDLDSRSAVVTARSDVEAAALATAVRATGQYNAFERRRRAAAGE